MLVHYAFYSREIADSLRNGFFFIYFLQFILEVSAKIRVINHSQKHEVSISRSFFFSFCSLSKLILLIAYILVSFCIYYSGGSSSGIFVSGSFLLLFLLTSFRIHCIPLHDALLFEIYLSAIFSRCFSVPFLYLFLSLLFFDV